MTALRTELAALIATPCVAAIHGGAIPMESIGALCDELAERLVSAFQQVGWWEREIPPPFDGFLDMQWKLSDKVDVEPVYRFVRPEASDA